MAFEDKKISEFAQTISDLADQPNMLPGELKAYFDNNPELLRQGVNALCDALGDTAAAANLGFAQTAGVPASTVQGAIENVQAQVSAAVVGSIPSGSITEDKLGQDVLTRLDGIEDSVSAEASSRASADSGLQSQISTHTTQINTRTTQIAQKCEIYYTTYEGDGTSDYSKTITVGFRPKVVIVTSNSGFMVRSAMALDTPSMANVGPIHITDTGFQVMHDNYSSGISQEYIDFFCLVLK